MTILELIEHLAALAQDDPTAKVRLEAATPKRLEKTNFRMGKGFLLVDLPGGEE